MSRNDQNPSPSRETQVLIVGAGPTGLALAISLQQAGIDHVIVDKLAKGLNTSRAGVIHAHTLEALEQLGVARALVGNGLPLRRFHIRDRDRALLQLRFDDLPSPHPYLLMLPQDQTERILAERLSGLGGRIDRGVTVTGVLQDAAGVNVETTGPRGNQTIRAQYVVGGDGMHSIVREAAGVDFEGGAYADSFVLADVRMDWSLGSEEVSLFFAPAGFLVVAPLPDGRFRVVAAVDQAPEHPALGDIQALVDDRGPRKGKSTVREVVWNSRFRIHHRVANAYRNKRLLLMGDAAHVHSPAGGQGMNTGLVDAVVLGQLLARAIRQQDDSVLDEYQKLRRPAAVQVLAMAGRLTSMATLRSGLKRTLRNAVLSFLDALPSVRRKAAMSFSGLSRKALAVVPAESAFTL